MQRAFDQLIHDMCFMDLAVTILGVRSGFAGLDSPTSWYIRYPLFEINSKS